MKRALLVFGPESSGTRLVARALVAMGADGDAGNAQRLDADPIHLQPGDCSKLDLRRLDEAGGIIVWRRSFPHGVRSGTEAGRWLRVPEVLAAVAGRGYAPHVVVTVRDPHCVVESQARRFGLSREEARANLRRAYREIYGGLAAAGEIPFTVCCFESLILNGTGPLQELGRELGLPLPIPPDFPIEDADARYYSR